MNAKDRRIQAELGIAPGELERGSFEHRQALRDAADTSRLEELREDLRRAEDLTTFVRSPHLYTVGLVLAWGVEFAGAVLVLRALGIPAEHRVLPALALTGALIALTHTTMKVTREEPPTASMEPGERAEAETANPAQEEASSVAQPFRWRRYAVPAAYALLVLAVATVRLVGAEGEDASLIVLLGEAVLMIAISVGPAFIATWLESKRAPAAELHRRLVTLRRRLRAEGKRVRVAEKRLQDLDRRDIAWKQANYQGRQLYSLEHELASAERDDGMGPSMRDTTVNTTPHEEE